MSEKKVLSFLGLTMKAGKLSSGEYQVENAVKGGKAALVIIALDASENTKKKFQNMCEYYQVPIYFFGKMEEIGAAIGKTFRASLAVTDENLAKAITKQMNEQ
ncbi:MAG: ribosomal L7Ae/L30e/S12e/Gadd45 family protein [Lachnospiraceae bacterium]|nr:ribosomal L7Ae/L30e/S12e/Gadd45 family protein [Lachnospiraceae bacterium]